MNILSEHPVLVLNRSWVPVDVVPLKDAICMALTTYKSGEPRAKILDPTHDFKMFTWEDWGAVKASQDEKVVRSAHAEFRVPDIIILTRHNKLPKPKVNFNRRSIYYRDNNTCFTPETLIMMADFSLKPISEVCVGDKVVDAYGKTQTVEYVYVKNAGLGEVMEIRRRGSSDSLRCTKEHRLLLFGANGTLIDEDGTHAEQVTLKSYLGELMPEPTSVVTSLDVTKLPLSNLQIDGNRVYVKKTMRSNSIPASLPFDSKLGRLGGYFLAEGSLGNGSVIFTFNMDEKEYVDDVESLVSDVFGLRCQIHHLPEKNVTRVICSSVLLRAVFLHLYDSNGDKRVMSKCYPDEYLVGLCYGVLRGDANFNDTLHRCTLQMSRENLIRDLKVVSCILGLRPTMSKTGVRKDGRIYKSLVFQGEQYNKVGRVVELPLSQYEGKGKMDSRVVDRRSISKVVGVKESLYAGPVYDLQVSGSHTYVANFVCVHNCQYCARKLPTSELSIEHVIPRRLGGKSTWENCVIACVKCNFRKGGRTPEQAGMKLLRKPVKPRFTFPYKNYRCKTWEQILGVAYWETELSADD